MTLQINPKYQRIWLDLDLVQYGVDEEVIRCKIENKCIEKIHRMLALGTTKDELYKEAKRNKIPTETVDKIILELEPIFLKPIASPQKYNIILDDKTLGSKTMFYTLNELFSNVVDASSVEVHPPKDKEQECRSYYGSLHGDKKAINIVVMVRNFVIYPYEYIGLLQRDITHISFVYSDKYMRLSHMRWPENTPCLLCLELHRRDQDKLWHIKAPQIAKKMPYTLKRENIIRAGYILGKQIKKWIFQEESPIYTSHAIIDGEEEKITWKKSTVHPDCTCSFSKK